MVEILKKFKTLVGLLIFFLFSSTVHATLLDSLENRLSTNEVIQEKVYVHLDNKCYFIGDTIWYKAYVVSADSHKPTNMSKVLYVELLSPDGLVTERQRIIVGSGALANGQFVLKDSLYSGFYEIRAYTKWMLNFNVSERPYTRDDRLLFYSNRLAHDFFRDWDGLYSRVIPIYSKPDQPGDYEGKYMYQRPKQEVQKQLKDKLHVSFFPEGGHLVRGLKSTVAFEVTDQWGQQVVIEGRLSDGSTIKTTYMGRGAVEVLPATDKLRAQFTWRGKSYDFSLPKPLEEGAVISLKGKSLSINSTPGLEGRSCALAITCRGRLVYFKRMQLGNTIHEEVLPDNLPAGVNQLVLFNEDAEVLCSRTFFIKPAQTGFHAEVTTDNRTDFMPYETIPLQVKLPGQARFSIAVRDQRTDDPTYDDGNMMTDLLLSSDLKGFVANPSYYFESDDATHENALNLLMLVQGWQRYQPVGKVRYAPEQALVFEGTVNKQLGLKQLDINDIAGLNSREAVSTQMSEQNISATGFSDGHTFAESNGMISSSNAAQDDQENKASSETQDFAVDYSDSELGVNHGSLKREVLVEAEVVLDGQSAGEIRRTERGGKFSFVLPPYYGDAVLFVKAYTPRDSLKKNMASRQDKSVYDEEAYSDFYINQELFYPVFAHKYSWDQTHMPDPDIDMLVYPDEQSGSTLDGEHMLKTVNVKAHRRGRRAIDYNKPAYVIDAYQLYNDATDRGLSWGYVNMGNFPLLACYAVYGNMNRYRTLNVRAKIDTYTFFKNYNSVNEEIKNRSEARILNDLRLKRLQNVRFFTDYEPRNPDSLYTTSVNRDDITLVYETIPNDGKRFTYRDRRYVFPGFAFPEDFYHPDYSNTPMEKPVDYRRTLYWNPNAVADEHGVFHASFYNSGKETRIAVSVAGITNDGEVVYY